MVFVYGTLKRGQANHHWLVGAEALGRTRLQGLAMHNVGPYPMAVPLPAPATDAGNGLPPLLHGELYRVDASGLARLDLLEDVPNEYQRLRRPLVNGQQVWVYAGGPEQAAQLPPVPFGDWGTTPVFFAREGDGASPAAVLAQRDDGQWGVVEHLGPEELEGVGEELVVVTGVFGERFSVVGGVRD
ncbi:gamma-glutamylcyclotransferase [Synechococcus sp. ATX 2A4]|nr:gamma-glutamylcyclotransferase [Synechococcus sp. ATX 2A4]